MNVDQAHRKPFLDEATTLDAHHSCHRDDESDVSREPNLVWVVFREAVQIFRFSWIYVLASIPGALVSIVMLTIVAKVGTEAIVAFTVVESILAMLTAFIHPLADAVSTCVSSQLGDDLSKPIPGQAFDYFIAGVLLSIPLSILVSVCIVTLTPAVEEIAGYDAAVAGHVYNYISLIWMVVLPRSLHRVMSVFMMSVGVSQAELYSSTFNFVYVAFLYSYCLSLFPDLHSVAVAEVCGEIICIAVISYSYFEDGRIISGARRGLSLSWDRFLHFTRQFASMFAATAVEILSFYLGVLAISSKAKKSAVGAIKAMMEVHGMASTLTAAFGVTVRARVAHVCAIHGGSGTSVAQKGTVISILLLELCLTSTSILLYLSFNQVLAHHLTSDRESVLHILNNSSIFCAHILIRNLATCAGDIVIGIGRASDVATLTFCVDVLLFLPLSIYFVLYCQSFASSQTYGFWLASIFSEGLRCLISWGIVVGLL